MDETYGNQKYSVNYVASLVSDQTEIIVLCIRSEKYDTILSNGVRAIGLNNTLPKDDQKLLNTVKSLRPTHIVIRIPHLPLIQMGLSMGAQVLPSFADSFNRLSLRQRWWAYRLVKLLNDPRIKVIANHNLNASKSLCSIGVNAVKTIPFDYPRTYSPDQYSPKSLPQNSGSVRIIYVGMISKDKGTFDVLNAIPKMKAMGLNPLLTVIGNHQGQLDQQILDLGIETDIKLLGTQPHQKVIALMRSHDAVIVPSRPAYKEGMPNTIFESLATRTPLIASNHPMFTPILKNDENCVLFNAGNANSIAQAVHRLLNAPDLYKKISANTPTVWNQLKMPYVWNEIIDLWLADTPESLKKLHEGSMANIDQKIK